MPRPCVDQAAGPFGSVGSSAGVPTAHEAGPGVQGTAALEAARAASLLEAVGRLSTDVAKTGLLREVVARAEANRVTCLTTAVDEEVTSSAVATAEGLARRSAEERERRQRSLHHAHLAATRPPLTIIACAVELVSLTGRLLPVANHELISDLAAALAAARAAAVTARLAVEANLLGISDERARVHLIRAVSVVNDLTRRSDQLESLITDRLRR